ncbi:hypothetical protein [Lysinibacillus sp. FSL K6-0102]|uniref:hypothetical protein n=1 Tax=Lysinibacillus sp. FSL K6-0102 TaxID=2975290 RepID=UPI0030FCE205
MVESPLEKNEVQITSQHRIAVDKLNFALMNRYEKKISRGKNTEGSGEFAYNKQNASYFGNLKALGKRLIEKEFLENLSEQDLNQVEDLTEAINKAIVHIDKVAKEVSDHLTEHITVDLGESTKGRGRKKSTEDGEESIDEVDAD